MDKIQITLQEFNQMNRLKDGVVHYKRDKIYKHSPSTLKIVKTIDSLGNQPVFQNIATPTAYLYNKKRYFGYVMKYYKKLKQVQEAIEKGIIEDIEKYALELLSIIEKLNKLNLCYWDFHDENILVDEQGNPYILDIDDMDYMPSKEDLHNQREYLTEFLLTIYLNKYKSVHAFANTEAIQYAFSDKSLNYIYSLGNLGKPVPELPYIIIKELKDKEKRDMIKSRIN